MDPAPGVDGLVLVARSTERASCSPDGSSCSSRSFASVAPEATQHGVRRSVGVVEVTISKAQDVANSQARV